MPTDDGLVVGTGYDGIDEAEATDGAGQGVQLGVGDAPGVGGIGPQVVDRDVDDGELVVNYLHCEGPPCRTGDVGLTRTG